jgi:hypothetical protein
MNTNVEQQIQEAFQSLPIEVQQAINNSNWKQTVQNISTEAGLKIEQWRELEFETLLLLIGEESFDDFPKNVKESVKIKRKNLKNVVDQIFERVLTPIMNIVDKEAAENPQQEVQQPIPQDPEQNQFQQPVAPPIVQPSPQQEQYQAPTQETQFQQASQNAGGKYVPQEPMATEQNTPVEEQYSAPAQNPVGESFEYQEPVQQDNYAQTPNAATAGQEGGFVNGAQTLNTQPQQNYANEEVVNLQNQQQDQIMPEMEQNIPTQNTQEEYSEPSQDFTPEIPQETFAKKIHPAHVSPEVQPESQEEYPEPIQEPVADTNIQNNNPVEPKIDNPQPENNYQAPQEPETPRAQAGAQSEVDQILSSNQQYSEQNPVAQDQTQDVVFQEPVQDQNTQQNQPEPFIISPQKQEEVYPPAQEEGTAGSNLNQNLSPNYPQPSTNRLKSSLETGYLPQEENQQEPIPQNLPPAYQQPSQDGVLLNEDQQEKEVMDELMQEIELQEHSPEDQIPLEPEKREFSTRMTSGGSVDHNQTIGRVPQQQAPQTQGGIPTNLPTGSPESVPAHGHNQSGDPVVNSRLNRQTPMKSESVNKELPNQGNSTGGDPYREPIQ